MLFEELVTNYKIYQHLCAMENEQLIQNIHLIEGKKSISTISNTTVISQTSRNTRNNPVAPLEEKFKLPLTSS